MRQTIVIDGVTYVRAESAPVTPTADAPLYVSDKPRCALHAADACSRKLSNPAGSHVPCSGATDPMHARLRTTHRHF